MASIKERKEINEIKRKYGQSTGVDWDTNAITPGTEFMDKIKNSIINACKEKYSQTVIFSDSSVPMEGEHKLISNLKKYLSHYLGLLKNLLMRQDEIMLTLNMNPFFRKLFRLAINNLTP